MPGELGVAIPKIAEYMAQNICDEVKAKIDREKEKIRQGAIKVGERQFIKEYLEWLEANTVQNPYQAFMQFLKDKGVEL